MMMVMIIMTNVVDTFKCKSPLQTLSSLLQHYKVGIVVSIFTDEETKAKRGPRMSSSISSSDGDLLMRPQMLIH